MNLPALEGEYLKLIRKRARELHTDGCSGPTLPLYIDACYEHDIHYRLHTTVYGEPITRKQADDLFRDRIKAASPFDGFSPMAHWRWAALRIFGYPAWNHDTDGTPLTKYTTLFWWKCKPQTV